MKAFIVVSLVCYLGAAAAGVVGQNGMSPDECRQQTKEELFNCAKNGLNNGADNLDCVAATIMKHTQCVPDIDAQIHGLGASLNSVIQDSVDILQCMSNIIIDAAKCIINGHLESGNPIVNWPVITKCVETNIPAAMACLPQA